MLLVYRLWAMKSSDRIISVSYRANELMKNPLFFIDLLLSNVALRYEIVVLCLIFEISQVDFVHYSCIIFFEKLHIADQILFVVLENHFYSLLAFLVLFRNYFVRLSLATGQKCLKLLVNKKILINSEKIFILRLLVNYLSSVSCIDSLFY
jgi:hypothetical protein